MLLYHYSAVPRTELKSQRAAGTLTQKELEARDRQDKLKLLPGLSYVDHISFFFDPVPSVVLSRIFGITHPAWHTGSTLYEHLVDTADLEDRIAYEVVESVKKTELYDTFSAEHNWVDDDPELLRRWKELELRSKLSWGELGQGRSKLETQIRLCGGHLDKAFLKAYARSDFEDNRMKYAANVPHVMIYPAGGVVPVKSVSRLVIGNNKRYPLE